MTAYRFSLIVSASQATHEDILNTTDALGQAGCTDASIRGHADGMELLFERPAGSLQHAIASAIAEVERAGYRVLRLEMERDTIPA